MKKLFLILILVTSSISSIFAQQEWEDAIPSGLKWDIDLKLSWHKIDLTDLLVSNLIPETKEDKKNNRWTSYNAKLNYQIKETRPFIISVDVTNLNNRADYQYAVYENGKQKWHKKAIYWGYEIGVNTTSGGTEYYTRNFSDNKSDSYYNTSVYDSDSKSWTSYYGSKQHKLKIEYDGDHTIKVYDNDYLVKTFYNAKSVCYFGFKAGTASKIQATNFKVQRKSNYGMALPKLQEAFEKIQKEDWYGAARDYTYVIETLGYKAHDVYVGRGFVYAVQGNYRSAIDDLNKALAFSGLTNEQKENAYYLRGLCKASLNDDDCVNDMRKAGQDGKVWLRENQLENYVVGSSPNSQSGDSNRSSQRGFLPEKFKKH